MHRFIIVALAWLIYFELMIQVFDRVPGILEVILASAVLGYTMSVKEE
ncbi:hypothetical protein fHeYen902_166 [Yersinia phage fHe-Yen9-02]|nr:hypothetical protein fHeYen902_166 [Yersinia phage fHe-Yen9-02]